MAYSIELYFEASFNKAIQTLWDDLAQAGVPSKFSKLSIRPHLTLAVMDRCNETAVAEFISLIGSQYKPLVISMPSIALLPGDSQVVFLSPIVSKELFIIHEKTISLLTGSGNQPRSHYLIHNWLPHCTLSKGLSSVDALKTLEICQQHPICG